MWYSKNDLGFNTPLALGSFYKLAIELLIGNIILIFPAFRDHLDLSAVVGYLTERPNSFKYNKYCPAHGCNSVKRYPTELVEQMCDQSHRGATILFGLIIKCQCMKYFS